jgi:hypothetical protein
MPGGLRVFLHLVRKPLSSGMHLRRKIKKKDFYVLAEKNLKF